MTTAMSRGLGSALHGAPPRMVAKGSALEPRLAGLEAAVASARGRLDDELLDSIEAGVARSTGRLRLSAEHTIVAIAGATGSGKSTTFNALAGADLSASGAQRPTTSSATAVVWSDDDLGETLDWLGVPAARQHRRADLPGAGAGIRLPEGLVLLDLPDHDSVEVAHHVEAERVVELADVLIWVVDPQKYADAAIHRRFLQPLSGHREVTMVVLNHIDTVPEERRQTMVRDLRKVLAADGLRDVKIIGTSARHGIGMDELRAAIRRRVEEKRNAALRVEADIALAADRLSAAGGDAPLEIPDVWAADLTRRAAAAAGIPALAEATARRARAGITERLVRPLGRRTGSAARGPRIAPIDRPAVDTAVRSLADNVCRDLGEPWATPIRAAATCRLAETDDRLDAELAALRPGTAVPGWAAPLGLLGWAGIAGAAAGLLVAADSALVGTGRGVALGAAVCGIAVLVGMAAHLVGRRLAGRSAAQQAAGVEDAATRAIARVTRGQVIDPMRAELAHYVRFRRDVDAAARSGR